MEFLNKIVERFIRANRKLKRWQRAVSLLAAVIVFVTTYALVLPAITLDKETASTQSGIEIAASDNEPDGDGTVYEAEPEEQAEEIQEEESENSQEEEAEKTEENESKGTQDVEASTEDSGSQSGSQNAEVSEEDNFDEDTEEQAGSKGAGDPADEEGTAPDTAEDDAVADSAMLTDETLTEGEEAEEIRLITEETQRIYEYVDEEYEDGIDDENDDGINDGYTVYAEFGADAKLPEGVELQAEEITKESDPELYEAYYEKALSGLQDKYDEKTALSFARFYDIKFVYNGEEVEPSGDVKVRIEYKKAVEIEKETTVDAVHFDKNNDEEPEVIDSETMAEKEGSDDTVKTVEFESAQFSVYGVIGSYTVDFLWEVDGKMYEFSLPGGGFVSFTKLVEMLGIIDDAHNEQSSDENGDENEAETAENETEIETAASLTLSDVVVSDAAREFAADVESVDFSSPELVDVCRIENDTTVGQIKENRGLEVQYSAELTEEQTEEINAQTVEAGDWALISMQPFTSEETLTVTMKDGEVFTIRVTDYQISTNVLTADGKTYKITVTFDDAAEIPAGTELIATEIEPGTDEYIQHLGKTWSEVNKEYLEQEERIQNRIGALDDDNEDEYIYPVNLDDARFFDITLVNNEEKIEPKAPVTVNVQYIEGLKKEETNTSVAGVAHFVGEEVELIEDVETTENSRGEVVRFTYMQDGFSDIGTYVGQETTDDASASAMDRIAYPKLSAMRRATRGSLKDELGEPTASKELSDNEDGTYTLSLNVTGASKKKDEQPKANILFVMDRSSSMSKESNKIYVEYEGDYQSGTSYYGIVNGNYVDLNYSNGTYTYTTNGWGGIPQTNTYTGTVYIKISRLKAEQDAMSILFEELMENNKDTNGNYTKDTVEISVISFADDRGKMSEGTEYPNGGSTNGWTYSDYTGLMTVVNNTNTPSGTNWEDALMYAKDVADAKKLAQPDEPVFVIFLTDGEPTAVYNEHGGAHHYIGDYGDVHGNGFIAAYKPSRDDAKAIVDEGYGFYGIFTFNPGEEQTRYLKRLVHYAYTGYDVSDTTEGDFSYLDSSQYVGSNFFNADSPENLASAFDDILATITTMIAHGNISIVDGLTTDAMTSTLVAGKADGFTYKVADEHGNTLYTVKATGNTSNPSVTFKIGNTTYSGDQVEVKTAGNGKKYYSVTANGKEYKMAFADFVNTGEGDDEIKELTWDLSAIGTLENQYTYSLETVVWPNQEAYDYVAALNNGLMEWNEATQIPVYEDETETKVKYYKNGVKDYPSIVWDPNKRVYSVLTNTKQELEYSIISTMNGVETIEGPYTVDLDTPDPMDLKATASALEKVWNINRDPSILYKYLYESKDDQGNLKAFNIGFDINQDGELYKEIDLPGKATVTAEGVTYDWSAYKTDDLVEHNGKTFSKRWSQDFSISTGLMLSEAQMDARSLDKSLYNDKKYYFNNTWYYVLEPGHDFKISEPAVGYEFDFEGPTYHPMLVDGVLTDVKFTTEGSTKRISGMEALEIDTPTGKSALTVFNTLRGYINVKKKVVDSDGTTALTTDNTEFTFEVELTNAMPVFEGDHIPWYGVNGLYYHNVDADDEYYQAEYKNGKLQVTTEEGGPYEGVGTTFNPDYADEQTITYLVDGKEVSVTICGNQMTPHDGNDTDGYKKVTGTARITQTETLYIANVPVNTHYTIKETGLAALGYQLIDIQRQVGTNDPAPGAGNIENGIEGEIVQNTETLVTYTNKCLITNITIQKTDVDGKGLEGAVFRLVKVGQDGHSESDASLIESVSGLTTVSKTVNEETKTYSSAFESNGEAQTINGLPDGTYRLYEVYVPAGYISTAKYIQFEIENRVMKNVKTDTSDTSAFDFTAAGNNSLALLKIKNTPGAALPNTGGSGTKFFTILGSILILGAGLLLWKRQRLV